LSCRKSSCWWTRCSRASLFPKAKATVLIEKLANLAGGGDRAAILKRHVTYGKVKTRNENVFYSIDKIHTAMAENRMISFLYYTYIIEDGKIKRVCRHDGKKYYASPWSLTWDDEFYYMLAFDVKSGIIKHFRVDKMAEISILRKERRGKPRSVWQESPAIPTVYFRCSVVWMKVSESPATTRLSAR
jgi:predicted DNA-binding transcriptional regulator YafY